MDGQWDRQTGKQMNKVTNICAYRQTGKQTKTYGQTKRWMNEGQTDTEVDRQWDRHLIRQTDRQTDRQI